MREEHGDPDVVEVRRVFPTKEKAILWESKVIQRMGAVKDVRFINRANQGKVFHTIGNLSEGHRRKISNSWTEERKKVASEKFKTDNPMFSDHVRQIVGEKVSKSRQGISLSEDHKKRISEGNRGKTLSEEHRQSISVRMIQERNPNFGKRIPEELIEKRVKKFKETISKREHWHKGRVYSDEYKQRMSELLKRSWEIRKQNANLRSITTN